MSSSCVFSCDRAMPAVLCYTRITVLDNGTMRVRRAVVVTDASVMRLRTVLVLH